LSTCEILNLKKGFAIVFQGLSRFYIWLIEVAFTINKRNVVDRWNGCHKCNARVPQKRLWYSFFRTK